MLIRTNMEDLRDTTHSKHYEVYRKDRLKGKIIFALCSRLFQNVKLRLDFVEVLSFYATQILREIKFG